MLRLSFVTGTEPDKWFQRFNERTYHGGVTPSGSDDPVEELFSGNADLALVRLPDARVEQAQDDLHIVRLYEEAPGVALPVDHTMTLLDALSPEELEGEKVMASYQGPSHVQEIRDGLQVVAANVGIVFAPRPLLKVLCGKKVEHRGYSGQAHPETTIALVWFKDRDAEDIQDFVGIAKGRRANSSRQIKTKKSATSKAIRKREVTQKPKAGRRLNKKKQRRRGGKR
ncbi:LysR family transcriptional regulator substrate-binding protein [Corynebacterium pseudopelargi]|uniref:LysR substrate binding domain protein n=1 Tax=Corynebacterium pseudopelargi TaxID=2080757 RepID=A0A3G6IVD6_9CORY|nr:LysR family transcriptional regulator substrate-binding protein [Corynebacterium pseudopelargi]AZA09596.1 LysR substrate binding domain protein [Corynebacterium pseudopelargi]